MFFAPSKTAKFHSITHAKHGNNDMTRSRHFGTMIFLLLACTFGLARAEVITLNPDIDAEYVVVKGDTLWDIADYYLAAPWQWPQVWQVNPQIENPHLIYPGDVLVLSFIDGKPMIRLREDSLQKRLSPQVRREMLDDAIPPIPLEVLQAFLEGPRVIDAETWESAPYVLAFADDRLLGSEGNPVYVRKLGEETRTEWQVLHKGVKLRDPATGDTLGFECTPVGEVELHHFADPATGTVTRVDREVLREDRLFETAHNALPRSFLPSAPSEAIKAQVAAVYDGRSTAGVFQVIAINKGSNAGLETGHVLQLHQDGVTTRDPTKRVFRDVKLPPLDTGLAMIFDVSERLSYALVMEASREIRRGDAATEPHS